MDLGGVTLTMDMDTVIANNTAGSPGDVISACVSQITAYGLEARLDPVYPLYCSIYDEGNGFNPTSHSITTDASRTVTTVGSTTEHVQPTTHHEDIHTGSSVTTTASTDMSSTMAASDPSTHTNNPYHISTNHYRGHHYDNEDRIQSSVYGFSNSDNRITVKYR